MSNRMLVAYLPERGDTFRTTLAKTDTASTVAAQVYDMHKSSLLLASHSVKLIWDKHRIIGKKTKAAHTAEEYKE